MYVVPGSRSSRYAPVSASDLAVQVCPAPSEAVTLAASGQPWPEPSRTVPPTWTRAVGASRTSSVTVPSLAIVAARVASS
ncbi:hypothetical protein AB0J71_37520 [Nonomuraea sp. NPDC049637]|uniref:hypothetical protein n=1 Tax=Nonomuraea sp. NPDC049637 TaxID=3154356 RepID=UPI0034442A5E